jgi:Family of unknown function (DUF6172)
MKKTYPLIVEGKNADRVLEAVKHDIRKYVKRCRGVSLPKDVDFWDFDCKAGADAASATSVHLASLIAQVDAVAKEGHASVYVEVLAKPGHRVYESRPAADQAPEAFDDI